MCSSKGNLCCTCSRRLKEHMMLQYACNSTFVSFIVKGRSLLYHNNRYMGGISYPDRRRAPSHPQQCQKAVDSEKLFRHR